MIERNESEQHFTRRLEAFSDVVIGFSLAQLGAALVVSQQGLHSFLTPLGLVNFLFPFAIVCSAWFFTTGCFRSSLFPKRGRSC
jgi:urea transporter